MKDSTENENYVTQDYTVLSKKMGGGPHGLGKYTQIIKY